MIGGRYRNPEFREVMHLMLSMQLGLIGEIDPSNPAAKPDPELDGDEQQQYADRNCTIIMAVASALNCGYRAGFRADPREEQGEWFVAYIELPTGQVSWHLPAYEQPWDGHSTEEKYRRVAAFIDPVDA